MGDAAKAREQLGWTPKVDFVQLVQMMVDHEAASNAILYNHESPRRPMTFVTRKITSTVVAIADGRVSELVLGNLEARRDWGWVPDYVDAMIRIARHDVGGRLRRRNRQGPFGAGLRSGGLRSSWNRRLGRSCSHEPHAQQTRGCG